MGCMECGDRRNLPQYAAAICDLATGRPAAYLMFQQDGAPPHRMTEVREILNIVFPGRWIGRGGAIAGPPRSPKIAPLGFYGAMSRIQFTIRKFRICKCCAHVRRLCYHYNIFIIAFLQLHFFPYFHFKSVQ